MLVIRLFRVGKKNQPAFKIVVTDKKNSSTRGRFVEEVGFYNPLTKLRNLKGDRVKYWMSVGAKPSETVHNMLVSEKIIEEPKTPKHKKSKKPAESLSEADNQAGPPQSESLGEEATQETPTVEVSQQDAFVAEPTKEKAPEKSESPKEQDSFAKEAEKPAAEDKKEEKTEEVKTESTEPTEDVSTETAKSPVPVGDPSESGDSTESAKEEQKKS